MSLTISIVSLLILVLAMAYLGTLVFAQVNQHIHFKQFHEQQLAILTGKLERLADPVSNLNIKSDNIAWDGYRKFVLQGKVLESEGIVSFYFFPHDKKPLPPFLPGQYLTFKINVPGQAKPVMRCYSLSDSPNHPDYYRVNVKKIPPPRDNP